MTLSTYTAILQRCHEFPSRILSESDQFIKFLVSYLKYKQTHLLVPYFFIMADQTKSVRKLEKLRQNRILKLEEKLDRDIRGYDHLIQYKDDHTASLRSDWVDENIRIIIIKHNYEINKAKKMRIKEFTNKERKEVNDEIE